MSWEDRPTGVQLHRIACLASILGIREPIEDGIETRREARNILYELSLELKKKPRKEVLGEW
jgi:hypothetical protein